MCNFSTELCMTCACDRCVRLSLITTSLAFLGPEKHIEGLHTSMLMQRALPCSATPVHSRQGHPLGIHLPAPWLLQPG